MMFMFPRNFNRHSELLKNNKTENYCIIEKKFHTSVSVFRVHSWWHSWETICGTEG